MGSSPLRSVPQAAAAQGPAPAAPAAARRPAAATPPAAHTCRTQGQQPNKTWRQHRQAGTHSCASTSTAAGSLEHPPSRRQGMCTTQHAWLLRAVAQHCTVSTLYIPTNTSTSPVQDVLGSQLHPQAVSLPAVLLLRRALVLQRLLQALLQLLLLNRRNPQRGFQASQLQPREATKSTIQQVGYRAALSSLHTAACDERTAAAPVCHACLTQCDTCLPACLPARPHAHPTCLSRWLLCLFAASAELTWPLSSETRAVSSATCCSSCSSC